MPRIVGVDIPNEKAIWIALTYIYGIGKHTSEQILKEAKIDKNAKAGKLTEDELSRITQIIDRNYTVGGQLRRQISQNIARLRDINCYRGFRHRKGPACSRSAHQDQCPHSQRTEKDSCRQEGCKGKTLKGQLLPG